MKICCQCESPPSAPSPTPSATASTRFCVRTTCLAILLLTLSASTALAQLPSSCTNFTDSALTPGGTTIKAVHLTELRACINDLRAARSLAAASWTDPVVTPQQTEIKAVHLTELRSALNGVYSAAGVTAPSYGSAPVAGETVVLASHFTSVRDAIAAAPASGIGCTVSIWPYNTIAPAAGGTGSFEITAGCGWTATSSAGWLRPIVTSGVGTSQLSFVLDPNPYTARSATISVDGVTFTVNQDAGSGEEPPPDPVGGDSGDGDPGSNLSHFIDPQERARLSSAAAQCVNPFPTGKGFAPYTKRTYRLSLDGVDDEIRECVKAGFDAWSGVIGVDFNSITGFLPADIEVTFGQVPTVEDGEVLGVFRPTMRNTGGYIVNGEIVIDRDLFGELECGEVKKFIAHELGHGFGLPNVTGGVDGQTIMRSGSGWSLLPDGPSACDKVAANLAVTYGDVAGGDTGGPSTNCPPGGCMTYGSYGCEEGYRYERNSGWCVHWELLSVGEPANFSPLITFTQPSNGEEINGPQLGTVQIASLDPDGRILFVEYYVDDQHVYTTSSHPFSWSGDELTLGVHAITAIAYDNKGATTSSTITIVVQQ